MGLFPSEAEVRRRRRDQSMAAMLYTEPDDYSEPRGTNEEKSTGTNEVKSTGKSEAKARRKWGLEDTRDMQRIEDEMDDEPILSAVLTASAARKSRGDKNSKKDTRKGEDRKRDKEPAPEVPDTDAPRGAAPKDASPGASATTDQTAPDPITLSTIILRGGFTTDALMRLIRDRGGRLNLLDLVRKFVFGILPSLTVSLMLSTGDSLSLKALALLGSIVCEMAGLRVELKFVSAACLSIVHGMMTQEGAMLPKLLTDLANSAGNWPTAFKMIPEYAKSVIDGACNVGIEILVNLSVHFIVGFERIISIIDLGNSIQGTLVDMLRSNMRAVWLENVFMWSAWTILLAIACVVMTVSIRRAFIATGGTAGITRRIASSLAASAASQQSTVIIGTRPNRTTKRKMVRFISLGVGALLAGASYLNLGGSGDLLTEQDMQLVNTTMQVGTRTSVAPVNTNVLFDAVLNHDLLEWFSVNLLDLSRTAHTVVHNIPTVGLPICPVPPNMSSIRVHNIPTVGLPTCPVPSKVSSIRVPSDDIGAPDTEPLEQEKSTTEPQYPKDQAVYWACVLTSALNNVTDTSVSPIGLARMIDLYHVTRGVFNEAASVITEAGVAARTRVAPWDSEQSLKDAYESAKTLAIKGKYYLYFQHALYKCFWKLQKMHKQWTTEFRELDEGNGLDPARLMHLAATATCSKSGPLGPTEDIAYITRKLEDMRRKITNQASPAATMITSLLEKLCHNSEAHDPYKSLASAFSERQDLLGAVELKKALEPLYSRHFQITSPQPWTSLKAIRAAHARVKRSTDSSPLLTIMDTMLKFYDAWDLYIQKIYDFPGASYPRVIAPDIVSISALSERAPEGKMPYRTGIDFTIERDGNGDPVREKGTATNYPEAQEMTGSLLAIDKVLFSVQEQMEHTANIIRSYRRELAVLIARLNGYKGPDLEAAVTAKLYDLHIIAASAKTSGNIAALHSALKAFVEEHKKSIPHLAEFSTILAGPSYTAVSPPTGADLVLSAVHRVYEFLREHTAAPNNNGTQHETQRPPNKVLSEEIAATLTSAVNQYTQVHRPIGTGGTLEAAVIKALRYLGVPTWDTQDNAGIDTINTAIGMVEEIFEQTKEGIDKSRLRHLLFATRAITRKYA